MLPDLTEDQCLANPDLPDQRITEYITPSQAQVIHAEPSTSTRGSPHGPIVQPSITYLASGDREIRCPFLECSGQKFGRLYDYERHYNGAHAVSPTVFWCDVVGCGRSEAEGDRFFPRKDKRNDHMRKMHGM
ncbi:hypothetical protein BU25DRAFT_415842 [Macroventuria anomochaeta]|uniref:Uncharacterized protein n=1 Tax=Macroventuria anomochaeta TaxID=301207 RepID=A0ACB6RIJ2_9PLEO|nr:uncharacterized protein BU25DRAFT_415842 [Macroventuria anomochaeta]KAF2621648.1 hypothetical protein BU25DRAFT_415842 [Macroventuria anomochaeta]